MQYFKYGKKEVDFLKSKDNKLSQAIDKFGFIKREVNLDVFYSLILNIIGKQISTKAAVTVTDRLKDMLGEISPETIYNARIEDIQECGITMRKAEYIKGIANAAIDKSLDFEIIYHIKKSFSNLTLMTYHAHNALLI